MSFIHQVQDLKTNKRFIFFMAKLLGLAVLWFIIESSNVLNESGLNNWVIGNLVYLSQFILSNFGYEMFSENDIVGIVGTSGVLIGAPCNALDLIALFLAILVVLPGNFLKKLIFSTLGTIAIHLLNLIRVIALILILKSSPALLEFNHNYTFTLIMYVLIFLGWILWVKVSNADKKVDKTS